LVSGFFRGVRAAYPETRETLRRAIDGVLRRERKYWHQLSDEDLHEIEKLAAEFEERSIHARLLKEIGQHSWDREGDPIDVAPLAKELVQNPEALASEWPWLTSGEAAESWLLGRALAEADARGELETLLPSLTGRGKDLRIICGYLKVRQEQHGKEWLDKWLSLYAIREPLDMPLFFEVSWRCEPTIFIASQVARIVREHVVPRETVAPLGFGWAESLPLESLLHVVSALADRHHESTAITILGNRLTTRPEEMEHWEQLGLSLITDRSLIRERPAGGSSHYWNKVVKELIPRHARLIARAIFHQQADRQSGIWLSEFSSAADVLQRCADADASGVWDELVPYLTSSNGYSFAIGFASGVVDRLPYDRMSQWVLKNVEERASLLAHFVDINLSQDDTVAARLLAAFGDNEKVSSAFFAKYTSGSWNGPASAHWLELAARLNDVANRTALLKVRNWAKKAIDSLRLMAEAELQREQEWDLRRR
jgi:hypothetical protein